ncbi:acyltransferase family protein [Kineosporia babensis]|uniref:Acyltransferase n=1 Tax=Kineosporia babensis TaxID=499548 RepID=A0A9X1SUB0_9ACTN|nr:acyltransferase [Kineosporia babensis]MCD5312714.1 acyltransferase [Kineosporia babensis]
MTLVSHRHENRALNVMRTVAAVVVCIGHVRGNLLVPLDETGGGAITQIVYLGTTFGHSAVIVFFVLSGYLVGGSVLSRSEFSWAPYLSARLTRLWLVLIPAVAITLVADQVGQMLWPDSLHYGPGSHAAERASLAHIVGNIFFLQSNTVEALGSNGPFWSLAYEFGYYLVFPMLVLAFRSGSTSVSVRLGYLALAALVLFVAGPNAVLLFPAWLAGAAVAHVQPRLVPWLSQLRPMTLNIARVVTLVILLGAMVLDKLQDGTPEKTPPSTFIVAAVTTLLVVLYLRDVQPRRRITRGFTWSANSYAHSSYSLYAVHAPLMTLLVTMLTVDDGPLTADLVGWSAVLGVTIALMAAGWLFASCTERHTAVVGRWVRLVLSKLNLSKRSERDLPDRPAPKNPIVIDPEKSAERPAPRR